MIPFKWDLLYEMFYVTVPWSQNLPRWSYVITLVSLFPPDLLSLVTFSAAVILLLFDGYRIIWVDSGCLFLDAFCTSLIIPATSRLCLGLTLFVVTKADVLVVLLFLLHRSFIACSLAGYFSIRCWVLQLSRDHSSFAYHLMGLLILTPFSLWFIFPLPSPPWPPRLPLTRPPLTTNLHHMSPLPYLPFKLTFRLRPYLPDYGWFAERGCDITVDKYVEAVLKLHSG